MKKPYKKSSGKRPKPTVNEGFKAVIGAGITILLAGICMAASTVRI